MRQLYGSHLKSIGHALCWPFETGRLDFRQERTLQLSIPRRDPGSGEPSHVTKPDEKTSIRLIPDEKTLTAALDSWFHMTCTIYEILIIGLFEQLSI